MTTPRNKKALLSLQNDIANLLKVANRAPAIAEDLERLEVETPELIDVLLDMATRLPALETALILAAFPDLEAAGIAVLPEPYSYSMESDSKKGEFYRLTLGADENGVVSYKCTCRAGIFRGGCKHAKRLTVLLNRSLEGGTA